MTARERLDSIRRRPGVLASWLGDTNWIGDAGSRHPWQERLLTFVTVTAITALVWIWATNQTRQTTDVTCMLHFVPASSERQIVLPAESIPIRIQFAGSRSEIERAVEACNGRTLDLAVGTAGVPGEPGVHEVVLADALALFGAIEKSGASVRAVQPAFASVEVRALVARDATVRPRFGSARLSGDAIVQPATVQLLLPADAADALPTTAAVDAVVPPEILGDLEAGRRHQLDLALTLPPDLAGLAGRVRIDPPRARIAFTLESTERSTVLRQVPVQVAASPVELAERSVRLAPEDEFLREVALSGPEDAIRAIERGDARIIAFVHLSREDFARGTARKEVSTWLLPPGVRVVAVNGSGAAPTVALSFSTRP